MLIRFSKYHGTGNDFVLIDDRDDKARLTPDDARRMCSRHFGIGSDGLIVLKRDAQEDFYMDFFNPDGSQSFCGNGSRCAVAFASRLGIVGNHGVFRAIDGSHPFVMEQLPDAPAEIRIKMRDVHEVIQDGSNFIINTGSPHYIVPCVNPNDIDLISDARAIRYNDAYKAEGINVNFVRFGNRELWMRTYERGVESETLSCGTGVTAAALSMACAIAQESPLTVHTAGGTLRVQFDKSPEGGFEEVWLCGPAERIFDGEIHLQHR